MAQMGSVFAQSMGILDMTENIYIYVSPASYEYELAYVTSANSWTTSVPATK